MAGGVGATPPPLGGRGPAEEAAGGSIVNEIFALAWSIASAGREEVDRRWWRRVLAICEECRTEKDWSRLLALLALIAEDPSRDKAPLYDFRLDDSDCAGLRGSMRLRGRGGLKEEEEKAGLASTRRRAAARHAREYSNRRERRTRLRELLRGAEESNPGEERALGEWLLDEYEELELSCRLEREILAEELLVAMRSFALAAKGKREGDETGAVKSGTVEEGPTEVGGDVLRTAAPTTALGVGETAGEEDVEGGGGGEEGNGEEGVLPPSPAAHVAPPPAAAHVETFEQQMERVERAEASSDLEGLSELLLIYNEEVCVRAALALSHASSRDEQRLATLATLDALPRLVRLLAQPFSERSLCDLTLVLKSLCANRAHHPLLLQQFVAAGGPAAALSLVGVGGTLASALTAESVLLIRSLADVTVAREGLVEAGALLRLLRLLLPATPVPIVDTAAAAIAVLLRTEAAARAEMLHAGGTRVLVALLSRGGASSAAVSGAAALRYLCEDGVEEGREDGSVEGVVLAKRAAHDAHATEALLPLLDGSLGDKEMRLSAAAAAAGALGALCECRMLCDVFLRAP